MPKFGYKRLHKLGTSLLQITGQPTVSTENNLTVYFAGLLYSHKRTVNAQIIGVYTQAFYSPSLLIYRFLYTVSTRPNTNTKYI